MGSRAAVAPRRTSQSADGRPVRARRLLLRPTRTPTRRTSSARCDRDLDATDGFIDATLERVEDSDGRTEIVVVTRWASMETIRAFAGDEVDVAVVEPEARAVLEDFETRRGRRVARRS